MANIDKIKIKNWVVGDTFAYKIKSEKYPEYNGRYLIFNMMYFDEKKISRQEKAFRVKITKDNNIPKSLEDLNELKYIVGVYTSYNYCNPKVVKQVPDEYGFLYDYTYVIHFQRKDVLNNFMYIGNYEMQSEPNEFHCYDGFSGYAYCYYEFAQDYIIDKYERYNLKKGNIYTVEGNYRAHNYYFELLKVFDDVKRRSDEYFKEHPINPENNKKKHRDTLTYVGPKKQDKQ